MGLALAHPGERGYFCSMSQPFAFLDRDGTIIRDAHYLSDPDGVELLPRAAEGLAMLREAGYGLAVVSNQSGVGRGYFTVDDVHRVNARMQELLARDGVRFDALYYCPHTPGDACDCRKPLPGMLRRAEAELHADLARSVVIGDKTCDVELGRAVGAVTILVRTGRGLECERDSLCRPDHVADDLAAAAIFAKGLARRG